MRGLTLIGGSAAAIAAMGLAMPAQAQGWRGPPPRHHQYRSDNGDGLAGFLLGALAVGGVVAIANSEKKRRAREAAAYEPYDVPADVAPPYDVDANEPMRGVAPADAPPPYGVDADVTGPAPAPDAERFDGQYDEDAAADACASAAESMGERYARMSRVTSITSNVWNGRSWSVGGKIELFDSYNQSARRSYDFRCALKAGNEPNVTIRGLEPAV